MRAQDCRRTRPAAALPAVVVTLVILAATSPVAASTRTAPPTPLRPVSPIVPVRPTRDRLFSRRPARHRFTLFAASDSSADSSPAPLAADGSQAAPARPGTVPGAGAPIPDGPGRLTLRIGHDLRGLARAPFHAHRRTWAKLAGGALVVGLVHLADDDIRSSVRRESADSESWATTIRPLGQEGGLALAFVAWGAGKATGHDEIAAIGEDSLEATIVAAGFVAPLLKLAVGRDRPRSGSPSESFSGGAESFPSGEVTEAFAMASVIAAHSQRRWVDALAWGAASSVAWERLRLDAHWASDVAAGALIGTGIGRWVVRRNRPREIEARAGEAGERLSLWNDWTVTPLIGAKDYGLGVRVTF